ncbi:MAG TPA: hypothetical protein PKV22_00115 [Paludibacteraceae bacterium]|nr:hypothetical protein [Paludibacteraceae bacterium]HQH66318.1 hypothetical protein [Clostridia bacterium]
MSKIPKKPVKRKYPKMPKKTASLKVWENYKKRCADIDKINAQKLSEYKKKIAAINSGEKKKESIIKGIAKKR